MKKDIKVAAIIVTYNGINWIEKCLTSLKKSLAPLQTIVIDNGSTDGTQKIIANFPEVTFIQSDINLGFGRANNKGIEIALAKNAKYIFLLNQDAWIEPNTISVLLQIAEDNRDYGVISPVHLNGTYSGLDLNFSKQLVPENCSSFYSDLYVKKLKILYEITFVNAAAWLISKRCFETVGFFEPLFFLYGEDNNFLQRVTYHKLKIGVTPYCTICHDREMRQGSFSETGIKIWERTYSLIGLLNILNSYSKSILSFLKEKFIFIIKCVYQKKFTSLKYPIKEIFFFIKNIRRLYKIRKRYKFR